MKALSVWQPWAWCIIHCGKDIENRTWRTNYRGDLLIHASKRDMTRVEISEFYYFLKANFGRPRARVLLDDALQSPRGGIIGSVRLVDCVTESDSLWFGGPFGFVLDNPKPIPFISVSGHQGIFHLPVVLV